MPGEPHEALAHSIVLFDGVCNLCSSSVRFIIDRDPQGVFKFASLQSPIGQELLIRHGLPVGELQSMVLLEGGRAYMRSEAALRIARRLGVGWRMLAGFLVVPRALRDRVYNVVASSRYKWFGKSEICVLPSPANRDRFLG